MKNASETYGAARLGNKLFAARVENDGARLRVTSLLSSDDDMNGETLENGRLFFNIDERLAVVKKIKVRQSSFIEASRIAQFELAQSLLEPAAAFYFDTLPLDNRNGLRRYLSIAYHRPIVDLLMAEYQERLRKPSGFKLDAVAMTDGYRAFCRVEQGDLQVLVNIESDIVTLAFLYKKQLESVGRMEVNLSDDVSASEAKRFAADFKMTLNFHLAELFNDGITVPLSRIILSGSYAGNDLLKAALAERFTIAISLPGFHKGYFDPPTATLDKYKPEQFLIPLGLAVE